MLYGILSHIHGLFTTRYGSFLTKLWEMDDNYDALGRLINLDHIPYFSDGYKLQVWNLCWGEVN